MARLLELTLNGRPRVDAVPDNRLLLDYLRETVGLTGTKTGCDGGRQACGHRGIIGPRRHPLGRAARLPRQAGFPMRLLHARFRHGLCWTFAPQSSPHRGRDPRRAGQQHLPVHRLREDHRSGGVCFSAACGRGGDRAMTHTLRLCARAAQVSGVPLALGGGRRFVACVVACSRRDQPPHRGTAANPCSQPVTGRLAPNRAQARPQSPPRGQLSARRDGSRHALESS